MIKHLLIALTIAAGCTDAPEVTYQPDAGMPPTVDAGVPKRPQTECNMGNLPFTRTISLITGDTMPPPLVDELQDQFVNDRRTHFKRQYFPQCWASSGASSIVSTDPIGVPVWALVGTSGTLFTARLTFEPGETFESLEVDLAGDGAVDWAGNLWFSVDVNGTSTGFIATNGAGVTNEPNAWRADATFTNTPTSLTDGGVLYLQLTISGGTLRVGNVTLGLSR